MDNQINSIYLEFFHESCKLYKNAFHRAESFYKTILQEPFDYDSQETLEPDMEKFDFRADSVALREYWRKLLKYDTLTRIIDKRKATLEGEEEKSFEEIENEARENTREMYDKYFDRMSEFMREDDLFAQYVNAITMANDPHSNYFSPKDKQDFEIDKIGRAHV